jgi:signal transduction histidine kinase
VPASAELPAVTAYHYDPMLWPTLGSAAFIGAIALYLWRRRADTRGAFPLALVAVLLVLWCLGAAAEAAAVDVAAQRTWFLFRDALTIPSVILAFWFALTYAGLERWLTRPVVAVMAGVTIVHVELDLVLGGGLTWSSVWWNGAQIQGTRTPLGLAFAGAVVLLFVLSTSVFLLLFVRSPAHRTPVALILVGQVAIRVLYPIGVFNIAYVPNIVSGVVSFDCVAVMYAVALFRFRLFDLVPVARQTILQRMPEAMLVLGAGDRVADLNDTATRLLQLERRAVLGQPAATALAAFPDLARAIARPERSGEASFDAGSGSHTAEISSTPLADWQGRPIGRLVLLHDISALRRVEAQLVEHERSLAAAKERERLARDLHDSLGQVLGYLGLQAATIRKLAVDGRLDDVDQRLGRVAAIAGEAQLDVRRTIAELARSSGTDGDFLASLRCRLDGSRRDYAIATSLAIAPSMDGTEVPAEAAGHLLRIVDEAITNAIRHGEAHEARVSLERDDSFLSLSIEDDGLGFDTASVLARQDGRYGLRFMRERATELGGDLEIRSAPGRGTRVTARIPLHPSGTVAAT